MLFRDVWQRAELPPQDRSFITVSVLVVTQRNEQLDCHPGSALENGLSTEELSEALTHIAFHEGWPSAMSTLARLESMATD